MRIFAIAAACLALTACASTSIRTPTGKALAVAEVAVDGGQLLAEQGVKTGLLKGSAAQRAYDGLATANLAVSVAYAAWIMGDTKTANAQLQIATDAIVNSGVARAPK